MMENYLRHCISYLASRKSFWLGIFFFSCLSQHFQQFNFFQQLFWHSHKFKTFFYIYFIPRFTRDKKYVKNVSNLCLCRKICKKSQKALEKKIPAQKFSCPPNKKCNDINRYFRLGSGVSHFFWNLLIFHFVDVELAIADFFATSIDELLFRRGWFHRCLSKFLEIFLIIFF